MNRQATPHSNYCLAVPLDYQLIQLIFDLDNSSEAVGYPTYVSEWQRYETLLFLRITPSWKIIH